METSLQRAVELNPDYATGYSYLADIKLSLGRTDEARGLAQRAVSLQPGGSYHHGILARVLAEQSKPGEALTEAQRAVELAQADWERENAGKVLDYVRRKGSPGAMAAQAPPAAQDAGGSPALTESCLGSGDPAACAKVVPELDRFCGAGDGNACGALGWIHESGRGVTADVAKAAALDDMPVPKTCSRRPATAAMPRAAGCCPPCPIDFYGAAIRVIT